jgi:hypothetical protein
MRYANTALKLSLITLTAAAAACDSEASDLDNTSTDGGIISPEEAVERMHIAQPTTNLEEKAPDSLDKQSLITRPSTRVECSMFVINDQMSVVASSSQELTVPPVSQGDLETFTFGIGGAGNGTTARFSVSGFDASNLAVNVAYSFGGSPSALTSIAVALIPNWKLLVAGSSALVNGIVLTPQNAPATVGSFNNITQVSFSCTSLGV